MDCGPEVSEEGDSDIMMRADCDLDLKGIHLHRNGASGILPIDDRCRLEPARY